MFSEPQFDTGQQKLSELLTLYENSTLAAAAGSADGDALNDDIRKLGEELKRSVEAVQHDRLLAESFANAGNVILGLTIETGIPRGRPDSSVEQFRFERRRHQIGRASIHRANSWRVPDHR